MAKTKGSKKSGSAARNPPSYLPAVIGSTRAGKPRGAKKNPAIQAIRKVGSVGGAACAGGLALLAIDWLCGKVFAPGARPIATAISGVAGAVGLNMLAGNKASTQAASAGLLGASAFVAGTAALGDGVMTNPPIDPAEFWQPNPPDAAPGDFLELDEIDDFLFAT